MTQRKGYHFWTLCFLAMFCAGIRFGFAFELRQAAMDYNLQHWTIADGLPQSRVNAISQTPDGYMWFGTQEGLVRFNGQQFVVFDQSNTPVMQNNDVQVLFTARDGTLWIGTWAGGVLYYRDNRFNSVVDNEKLPSFKIQAIFEEHDGTIWVGTDSGAAIIKNNSVVPLGSRYLGLNGMPVTGICETPGGNVIIASRHKIFKVSERNLETIFSTPDTIQAFCAGPNGVLRVGLSGGLLEKKGDNIRFYTMQDGLPDNNIQLLYRDHNGILWIGSRKGVSFLKDGKINVAITGQSATFRDSFFLSIFEDRDGNPWFGTPMGLLRLSKNIFITIDKAKNLSDEYIYTIIEDHQSNTWIGSASGLDILTPEKQIVPIAKILGLSKMQVRSLYQDPNRNIWIGTFNGLFRVTPQMRLTAYTTRDGLPGKQIRSLRMDRKGRLWIATDGGLCSFKNGIYKNYTTRDGLLSNEVLCLYEDKNGRIWIGTDCGVNILEKGKLKKAFSCDGEKRRIFLDIFSEKDSTLWFATYGSGLIRLKNDVFTELNTVHGIVSDNIFALLEDDWGYLWMSCNKGVFKARLADLNAVADGVRKTVPCILYGTSDGMKRFECNGGTQPAAFKTREGKLIFPTIGGIVIADPTYESRRKEPPPVMIERVVVDSKEYESLKPAVFPAGSKVFEFSFVGINYTEPGKVRYRYQLLGINNQWISVGGQETINFSRLGPGSYTFRVTAADSARTWNRSPAEFHFRVLPFFYQTGWFYALVMILAFFLVVLLHKIRVRQLKRRKRELSLLVTQRTAQLEEEKQRTEEALAESREANRFKMELLGIAAHDLKNPLQIIMGFAELIKMKPCDPGYVSEKSLKIFETSQRMFRLVQGLLRTSTLESGKVILNRTEVDISRLAGRVAQLYREFAATKDQVLELDLEPGCTAFVDSERILEVMDNLLSNAVKYSPEGKVIRFQTASSGTNVRIIVEDEGPGLTEEDKKGLFHQYRKLSARPTGGESSTGLGLSIAKQLVELHQGKIWAESQPGRGARFVVEIPET